MIPGIVAGRAVTGGGGGGADPYFAYVVALLHFDGADASTTISDQTGRAWAALNQAQLDTSQSKFGAASLLLDGVGDAISTDPGSTSESGMYFGTNDFTVECWVRHPNSFSNSPTIWSQRAASTGITFRINSAGKLEFFYGSGLGQMVSATSIRQDGSWDHVAIVREATSTYLFINGVLEDDNIIPAGLSFGRTNPSYIGRRSDAGSENYNGHMDDFRATNGIARYTAGFTPPTAPFPNS